MNISNISVNKFPVSQILDSESRVVFEIPKYQREYTWGSKEWMNLYDDLKENGDGYFLGSIICINETTFNSPKYKVVDGQQRLTTISLFLAALYTIFNNHYTELDEDQQADILQLKRKLVLKKSSDVRILPQIQASNREDYLALLSHIGIIEKRAIPNYAPLRRIMKAYYYFYDRIREETKEQISCLFEILDKVNSAILVMIEVTNHADAYTLFESVNDRGTPLSSVDLIKNMLLARLDEVDPNNQNQHFDRWQDILNNLGSEYSDKERFFRQNYNAFRKKLNKPFDNGERQYPLGPIATRTTMLDIYEKIIKNNPKHVLEALLDNSLIYSSILALNTHDVSQELINSYLDLQRIQGSPSYLLLLYLVKNRNDLKLNQDSDIAKICNLLVRFFVRRNLTNSPPTRDLTYMFMAFVDKIEENGYVGDSIYDNLRSLLIDRSVSDEVFEEKLHGPVYTENTGATRFILCAMAGNKQADLWQQTKNKQYVWSIEHIFPQGQNIPDVWVDMIADGDLEKAKEYQGLYVHTFGNLTITGYNSTLGNKSFAEKKDRKDSKGNCIGYNSGLSLNEDVYDKDVWTVEIIQDRTDRMVKKILSMFAI